MIRFVCSLVFVINLVQCDVAPNFCDAILLKKSHEIKSISSFTNKFIIIYGHPTEWNINNLWILEVIYQTQLSDPVHLVCVNEDSKDEHGRVISHKQFFNVFPELKEVFGATRPEETFALIQFNYLTESRVLFSVRNVVQLETTFLMFDKIDRSAIFFTKKSRFQDFQFVYYSEYGNGVKYGGHHDSYAMNMMTNLDFSYQFGYLDASFDLSFKILASAHIGFNHALDTIYFARQSSAFDEVRDDFLDANNVLEKGKWFVLLYHDQLYIFTGNHSQIFYFENIDLMEYNKNERVYQLEVATMSYYQFFNCQKLWDNDFSSSELGKMQCRI